MQRTELNKLKKSAFLVGSALFILAVFVNSYSQTDLRVPTSVQDGAEASGQSYEDYAKWTIPGSGTVSLTKLHWYDYNGSLSGSESIQMAIYEGSVGGDRLSEIVTATGSGSIGWVEGTLATPIDITLGTTYYFGSGPSGSPTYATGGDADANDANYLPNEGSRYVTASGGIDATVPTGTVAGSKYSIWGITYSIANEDYNDWSYDQNINLNTTITGAEITGAVYDFPVLVRLNNSNFNFGQAKADGSDIRFSKSDIAQHLYYDMERYDNSGQVAEFWVKVDTVYGNNNSQSIKMHWGNGSAPDSSNAEEVFLFPDFAGVWHLNEHPAETIYDRTSNANHGTSSGSMNTVDSVDGTIGTAIDFDGIDDKIDVGSDFSLDDLEECTIGAWIYPKGWGENNLGRIIDKSNGAFAFYVANAGGGNGTESIVFKRNRSTTNTDVKASDYSLILNSWAYVVAVMNSTSSTKLYIDGNEAGYYSQEMGSGGLITDNVDNLIIGNSIVDRAFNGIIDELRIEDIARSADWIKLCYENQRPENTLINGASATVKTWDYGAGNNNWSSALNWNPDGVPTSTDSVVFNGTSIMSCNLTSNVTVSSITFTSGYTGTFNLNGWNLSIERDADFSIGGGGSINGAGGVIEFIGANSRKLIPPSSGALPGIRQSGLGTTTIEVRNLYCDSLVVNSGVFDIGAYDLYVNYDLKVDNTGTFNGSIGMIDISGSVDIASSSATFNAPSDTLCIGAGFYNDFGGTFNSPISGIVIFDAFSTGNSIYPGSAFFNHIIFNGSGGDWWLNQGLYADTLTMVAGSLICGTGYTHSIGNLYSSGGAIDYSNCTLSVNYDADFWMLSTVTGTNGKLKFIGGGPQYFTPNTSFTYPRIEQNGSGTVFVSGPDLYVDTLIISSGTFDMNSYNLYCIYDLKLEGTGTFTGSSGQIKVYGNVDIMSSSATFNAPSDTLFMEAGFLNDYGGTFNSSSSGVVLFNAFITGFSIYPGSSSFSHIVFNGAGGGWNYYQGMNADTISIVNGAVNFGDYIHTLGCFRSFGGTVDFNACTVNVNYDADFSSLTSITAGTAKIKFTGTGTQVLTPMSSTTLPTIGHTGSSTLQLATNNLICNSFYQDAGVLDFNLKNIQTVTGGDFTVTNGTSSSFMNLGGDTITVAGNASFSGQVANLLNMNPASTWYLNVTGTLNADYANIGFSDASGGSQGIPTVNCTNSGINVNWAFNDPPTDIALGISNVNENEPIGTVVGTFSTTDPNGGDTHSYSLVAGTGDADNASFTVDADSLKTAEVFDFETKSSYSIRVRTTDNGVGSLTYEEAFNITVLNVNDAPVLSGSGGSINYTENDTATVIDNGIIVSDIDNANLTSAQVSISANFAASEDSLLFADQGGITGSYNSGTGVLSLSGSAIAATYQAALRSVKYINSSQTPSTATRTISFSVNDGALSSSTMTRDVAVAAVNDAPVMSGTGGSITYTENDPPTVIDNGIIVSDVDNTNLSSAEVSISVNYTLPEDVLIFTDQNGITGGFDSASGVLTLTGSASLANYETALRSVNYRNFSDSPNAASRTVSFAVNDGVVNSNTVTRDISVNPINDAPFANDTSFSMNQNDTLNILVPGVMANDSDPEADPLTAILVSDVNNGILTLNTNGSFQYIPTINYCGIDSFVYQAFDGSSNSNAATVTINVNDATIPSIVSVSPVDNSTGVGVNDSLVVVFSEIVYADIGNIYLAHSSDLTVFETIPVGSGNVSGSGTNTITIDPTSTFASETGYYVLIDSTCFKDSTGNYFPGITSDTQWNFTTEDILTQAPTLTNPASNAAIDSNFTIDFTLPENALSVTVRMTFTRAGGNTDANSPHIITFLSSYEVAGTHSTTLWGKDLSYSALVASVSSDPNDSLVNGAVYDVKIEYQDALGNPVAQATNTGVTYDPLLEVISASYFEGSDKLMLVFDTTVDASYIFTSNKMGLWVDNGTADSITLTTPWGWSFGLSQDTVYISLDTDEATMVESWADINISLSLYLEVSTFGNGTVSNNLIDYSHHYRVTYFDDNEPPLPVTGLTASALNCSTMVVNWTPSTSPDAKEVKICASSIAMPTTQDSGEFFQMVGSTITSVALTGLPKYGATMSVAAFVVDNAGNWSAFSAGASNTVKLPDGVPPDNTIEAAFTNVGDSAVAVSIDLADTIGYIEAGIYFSLSHSSLNVRSSYPDTTISLTLGFHDTTFTMFNIVKTGWWHGTWAPFDSADNIGPEKSDSIMINNTPPVVTVLYQYTLYEDSAWTIDNCAYDINDDPVNLTLINAPLGMFVSQTTLSVTWTPGDEDVGLHTVGLVADDGTAQSDTILIALTVLNTNDSPILMSAFFPDTAFEDSLVEGEIAVYDPDNDDSLNISFNIRISWLTATVTPPTATDSLWRFKLKGSPGNDDTGTVQFTAIIKDIEDISVSSDHALYVVNTNDAPVTQLIKKQVMFGAAQYVMAGVDDFDSLLTFYATFDEIDTAEVITRSADVIINNDGVFTFYPLADGRYFFTCYAQDQAGVADLTPFEDTLTIANVMSRIWSDSGAWNMVSVPVPSYSAEPFKAAGKILRWDESREPNDIYKYYLRSSQISELTAGYSYWIRLDSAVSVTLDKDSLSKDTMTIPLHKAAYGWNQIASPYIYPVRWEKDLTLWKWNTVVHDFEEAEGVLYPWEGYWTLTDSEDSAAISPEPYFISKALARRSRTCFVDNKEWTFGIELTSNINRDADNLFGISRHAKNGYDKLDRPEPPRMGGEPYLFFAHPEWKRSIDEFASDIRRTWDDKENVFQIGISPCAQDVTALTLNITGYSEDMKIYLFVNTSSGVVKYNEGMALSVEPSGKVQYLTVFATSNKDFLNNFPRKFVLNHPYPNPCRPSATIRYTLPYNWGDSGWLDTKPYKVKMVIYDARGRVVRELVNRKQKPGQYKVVWRGKTDTGRRIASGFYFCRLVAGKHSSVRKIIAIR